MKKILSVLIVLSALFLCSAPAFAAETEKKYVVDEAGLLSDAEYEELSEDLASKSKELKFDIVVLTVDSLGDMSSMELADDYYDNNGYGYGDTRDGCLLLVSMEDRDWWLSTTGYGITALTDAGIDYISDEFLEYLGDDEFYEGFTCYGDLVEDFVNQARTGEPYDSGNLPKKFTILILAIGLGIGLVIAIVVILILQGQLKTVAKKADANDYLVQGSLNLTGQNERFITAVVSKSARQKQSSGSSTHTGSSGTSHGGGGGKF